MSPYTEAELAALLARNRAVRVVGEPSPPPLAQDTPEGTLLAKIRAVATPWGWKTYHTHDSRKSESGFPDLFLTNGVSILMYELKDNRRKLDTEQALWLSLLAHTGKVECGVWRPRDWPDVYARLTRRTHP